MANSDYGMIARFSQLRAPTRCAAVAVVLVLALLALATPASAQKQQTLNYKGELLNSFTGACSSSTYDMKCPSGSCSCQTYFIDMDNKAQKATGGLIGKSKDGTIDITLDGGSDFVGTGGFGNCRPLFASAFINGDEDTEQLDFTGTFCSPPKASSSEFSLNGGFGIVASTGGHQGFGTVEGTLDDDTGELKLKFKGPAS